MMRIAALADMRASAMPFDLGVLRERVGLTSWHSYPGSRTTRGSRLRNRPVM